MSAAGAQYSIAHTNYTLSKATKELQNEFAYHPFNAQIASQLSLIYLHEKNLESSQAWAMKALQLWPAYVEAHLEIARIMILKGKTEEALKEYRIAWQANALKGPSIMAEVARLVPSHLLQQKILPEYSTKYLPIFCEQLLKDEKKDLAQICFDKAANLKNADTDLRQRAIQLALNRDDIVGAHSRLKKELARSAIDGDFALLTVKTLEKIHGARAIYQTSQSWLPKMQEPEPLIRWLLSRSLDFGQFKDAEKYLTQLKQLPSAGSNYIELGQQEASLYLAMAL